MEHDIFISYSRNDSAIVDQFVDRLTEAGYRVWIDREGIYSGDQFKAKIVRAIKDSAVVLFFSSANSNASEWTVKEISYSLKKGKTIIPIKLDDAEYEDSIDFDLVNIDFIQYQQNDFSSAAERLIASVAKHLSKCKPESDNEENLSPEELYSLGKEYYDNEEYEQAVEYFRPVAEQGNIDAQCFLGYSYYNIGNYQQAVIWYRKAAEQGDADAQCQLGECYWDGEGVQDDDQQAVYWFRKAAEQGYVMAQFDIGFCYEYGRGVQQDYQQAAYWYRKAAEQGDDCAQYSLGIFYMKGQGVQQDHKQAVYWYKKAAEQGHFAAKLDLGDYYFHQQDYQQAVYWYKKAAEHEHYVPQYKLGECYEVGRGVPKDLNAAKKWYKLSAEHGFDEAIEALKRLNA